MNRDRAKMVPGRPLVGGLLAFVAAAAPALAQPGAPQIGYVYPAGGQRGTTFEVVVGGQGLNNVSVALVSGSGVRATVLDHVRPINQGQIQPLRDRMRELMQGPRDANAMRELAEIRRKMAIFAGRPSSPAIVETVRLRIVVSADAEPGERDLRLVTPNGATNPRVFQVGQFPEVSRKPTVDAIDANKLTLQNFRSFVPQGAVPPTPEVKVTLPAVVNGQIMPGGVDRYRFRAARGQRLVAAASARELVPYLADAVPGWFQAVLALYDANGHEVAYDDDYRYHPDPVLSCEIPKDGEYVLEIRDAIYRGREDFVYRIAVGELPYVTGVFPLGGPAGAQTAVRLSGWNLPAGPVTQDAREKAPGIYSIDVRQGKWVSNRVRFAVDDLPECLEKRPNHSRETAQAVTLPVIVNGRIDARGEWDVFRFEGHAGDEVVAEVHARRLGSPMDSVLKVTDAAGRQLAHSDDCEDKGCGLDTHHADSYLRVKLPAGGAYFVHLGDTQQQGGLDCAYRLRLSPPRPDFELRVAPSTVTVRPGASVPLSVYALRKDGFAGEIALELKNPPPGFSLAGGRIPPGADQVRVTLAAPLTPMAAPVPLQMEGRASAGGRDVVRQAVPAEDMMQAFAYRHLVPARDLYASVVGRPGGRAVQILSGTPVRIPAGGTARMRVNLPLNGPAGAFSLELNEPPEGISIQSVSPLGAGTEIVLRSDGAKAKAGLAGNLIFNQFVTYRPAARPATRPATAPASASARAPDTASASGAATRPTTAPAVAPPPPRRNLVGVLPAVPFEIVAADKTTQK